MSNSDNINWAYHTVWCQNTFGATYSDTVKEGKTDISISLLMFLRFWDYSAVSVHFHYKQCFTNLGKQTVPVEDTIMPFSLFAKQVNITWHGKTCNVQVTLKQLVWEPEVGHGNRSWKNVILGGNTLVLCRKPDGGCVTFCLALGLTDEK